MSCGVDDLGARTADLCRKHGISEGTFYNWKSKFGGLDVSEARRLKPLERESSEKNAVSNYIEKRPALAK